MTPTISKSVTLTPNNENQSGASLEKLSNTEVTKDNINQQWIIQPDPALVRGGWIIGLHLDNTWGFDPDHPSQIVIDIIGNNSSPRPSLQFDHFIITFTINHTQYWSVGLRLDNSALNVMYPGIINGTNIAYGNIYQQFIDGTGKHRWWKAQGNGEWQNMVPQPAEMQDLNQWNLKFIIYNDPTKNNAIFEYTNSYMANVEQSQGKNFSDLIVNEGMDIYITSDDSNKNLSISSFKITYDIMTVNPTAQPTVSPRGTDMPSEHPTTMNPTQQPSLHPSQFSSVSPSIFPVNTKSMESTSDPTDILSSGENDDMTTSEVYTDNNGGKKKLSTLIIVIIAGAVLYIFLITFILYRVSKPKRPISKLQFIGMSSNSILPRTGISPTRTDAGDLELVTKMQMRDAMRMELESGGPHDDVPDTRNIDLDIDIENDIEIIGDSDDDIMTPKGTIDVDDDHKEFQNNDNEIELEVELEEDVNQEGKDRINTISTMGEEDVELWIV